MLGFLVNLAVKTFSEPVLFMELNIWFPPGETTRVVWLQQPGRSDSFVAYSESHSIAFEGL